MKKVEIASFGNPVEVRTFPKGRVELIEVGGTVIGRATFEPGWKWSESVKPIVHTDLCQAPHLQYHMSGVMIVEQDGIRHVVKAGDVSMLPPGHDAWIEGDEPVHLVDFQGMLDYANSAEQKVQDITEELRNMETRHRLILGSVSDGIIGINANGEITFNNPAAASLLGYAESEMLGRKLHQLVHHSYPDGTPFPESQCSIYLTFQDGQPRTVDSEVFWRKDGSSIPVEVGRRIRAEEGERHVPIIAVTASAFEEQRDEVLAAGCDEFLRKPFRDADVFELIGRHLKLEYVYAEEAAPAPAALPAAVNAARLGALPEPLRRQLHEASLALDLARCGELAEQVAALDPELGDWLRTEIKEMRFESLIDLCEWIQRLGKT